MSNTLRKDTSIGCKCNSKNGGQVGVPAFTNTAQPQVPVEFEEMRRGFSRTIAQEERECLISWQPLKGQQFGRYLAPTISTLIRLLEPGNLGRSAYWWYAHLSLWDLPRTHAFILASELRLRLVTMCGVPTLSRR